MRIAFVNPKLGPYDPSEVTLVDVFVLFVDVFEDLELVVLFRFTRLFDKAEPTPLRFLDRARTRNGSFIRCRGAAGTSYHSKNMTVLNTGMFNRRI